MSVTSRFTTTSILQKLVVAAAKDPRLENLAYGSALSRTNFYKQKLIKDFNNHLITKEIRAGPGLSNSAFLPVGNLFSFIGFYAEELDNPVLKIEEALKDNIDLIRHPKSKTIRRSSVLTKFIVKSPRLQTIWGVTPYPKGKGNIDRSGSWANDIESRGIDGFAFYVFSYAFSETFSRSTTGVQRKSAIRAGSFNQEIPYIRALLQEFRSKFKTN